MIEKFLRAKHWHIFIITFGIPIIMQVIMMVATINGFNNYLISILFPIITILYILGYLGWFWSIGLGLQYKVPSDIIMKVKKFKIFLIFPMVYIIFISLSVGTLFGEAFENAKDLSGLMVGIGAAIIFPLHIFSMFCMFYTMYFVAKTIKTVQLQRAVTFSDFAGEFFMIWFFPIGIWIIQPQINKIIEEVE